MSEIQEEEVNELQKSNDQTIELEYALRERTDIDAEKDVEGSVCVCVDPEEAVESCVAEQPLGIIARIPQPMRSFGKRVYGFFSLAFRGAFRMAWSSSSFAFSSIVVLLAPLMLAFRHNIDGTPSPPTWPRRNTVFVI